MEGSNDFFLWVFFPLSHSILHIFIFKFISLVACANQLDWMDGNNCFFIRLSASFSLWIWTSKCLCIQM